MKHDGGRPLPAGIERLLQAERDAPAPPPGVSARVLHRVGATLGAPVAASSGTLLASAKTYLVAAVLAAGLATVGARMSGRSVDQPPAVVPPAPAVPLDPATGAPSAKTAGTLAPIGMPAPARLARPAPFTRNDDGLAQQSAELLSARRALAAGDVGRARWILRQHARRWPRGALEQEREVLVIDTIAAGGDRTSARRRAERFLRRFPDSTLAATARQHLRAFETSR